MITPLTDEHQEYLRDESRHIGTADSISFPKTEAEVVDTIRAVGLQGGSITTQGARTGIAAGAVPQGGHVLNLSRMNTIGEVTSDANGEYSLTVQPGAVLAEVRKSLACAGLFFPPDPTETSASIGGMVAANASGALTFHYGSTRRWVRAIRTVLCDGSVLSLRRGEHKAESRAFSLTTEDGRTIAGNLPDYLMPDVKSAAGYYTADYMDMIDLFIGAEGTLGVITEIELQIIRRPAAIGGLTVFLPTEELAFKFVRILRGEEIGENTQITTKPVAIEYFNCNALNLLREMKETNPAFAEIPVIQPHFHTAVYIEFHCGDEDAIDEAIMPVMDVMANLGVSDEDTWFATNDREMERLKAFRHAIPEAVNLLIDQRKRDCPELAKLGTDMSVPGEELESTTAMYNQGLAENGLESVIFGHIGNNHLHVNILPKDMEEYQTGKALYLSWAQRIVEVGGSVSAEHGIGKIKAPFLKLMYGKEGIEQMRALKSIFDPDMRLNPGNLF